jgi:hypothetical protein
MIAVRNLVKTIRNGAHEVEIIPNISARNSRSSGLRCRSDWSTLGVLASAILVGQLLDTTYNFTWMPVVITAIVTAALTIVTGWLAGYGVLNQKPQEILRRIES